MNANSKWKSERQARRARRRALKRYVKMEKRRHTAMKLFDQMTEEERDWLMAWMKERVRRKR